MVLVGTRPLSLAGAIIILLLSGCGTGNSTHSESAPTSTDDNKAVGALKPIKSKDGLSQVLVPSSWEEIDGLNEAAQLQVGNRQQKAYFVVRTFSKRDWPGDDNLQNYAKSWVETFREFFEDTRMLSGPKELIINKRPAVQYEFTGVAQNNKAGTVLLHTTVTGREHFHELVAWTNQRSIEDNRAILQAVIASFTESSGKADE